MKTAKLLTTVTMIGAAFVLMPLTAGAAERFVSPTAGNPWLSIGNMKTRTDARTHFYSQDGDICVEYDEGQWEWQTPIQVDADNTTWTLEVAAKKSATAVVKTRAMSLNMNGSVNTLTSWFSTTSTSLQTVGTAYVPNNGTLFEQSLLQNDYYIDVVRGTACVNMYRASR